MLAAISRTRLRPSIHGGTVYYIRRLFATAAIAAPTMSRSLGCRRGISASGLILPTDPPVDLIVDSVTGTNTTKINSLPHFKPADDAAYVDWNRHLPP